MNARLDYLASPLVFALVAGIALINTYNRSVRITGERPQGHR